VAVLGTPEGSMAINLRPTLRKFCGIDRLNAASLSSK
jgi:hypothetical protein